MGVPRFYRWLAKRYPAFRCTADAGVQPHVDNLYLDLNGIVHQCARHDRGPDVPAAPEQEIFAAVFAEISAIVELVRPQQLLFLALDGVAPRAKLNQQRARRFVAAQEKPPRDDYESAPQWFDGNCITPGTAFMHALGDALAFLVRQKMGEDSHWAELDVVLSTTAVAGEGEHKIMEYIRQRNDPPSTVHCAYGADADLVLLALASHEPHFLVIREIPDYSSMRSVVGGPEVQPHRSCAAMEYMSIGVLRDYLRLDLCSPTAAGFFDIERAIDDFVLCSFLCGNDFLPHLPCIDIGEGALDAIVLLYRKMLPEWKGEYLTLNGEIAIDRFASFLKELSVLEPIVLGVKSAAGNGGGRGRRSLTGNEITSRVLRTVNSMWEERIERSDEIGTLSTDSILTKFRPKADKRPGDWVCPECGVNNFAHRTTCFKCAAGKPLVQLAAVETETETGDEWVEQSKREYYMQKLGITPRGAQQRKLCREFLKGMAWTLKYYVVGCESWGWFYPFHYAPFLSDMIELSHHCVYELGFELGQPYTPLQQLLAVLPPKSAWALPGSYRGLMLDQNSSICDFYPAEFAQDANGKRNDWEATILLDFIDERRLLHAANTANSQLTPLEAERNGFALPLRFRRTRAEGTQVSSVKSPFTDIFPDICSSVRCWQDRGIQARSTYKTQLRPGATCVPPPNPSLPVLWSPESNVTGDLQTPGGVYVFGETKSTKNSIVLMLEPNKGLEDNVERYKSLCGAVVSINWPWQQLAVCTGLLAEDGYVGNPGLRCLQFDLEKKAMLNKYRSERGLRLPEPKIIVYARPVRYAAEVSSGHPVYGTDDAVAYPLSCVGDVDSEDWRVAESRRSPLQVGAAAIVVDTSSAYFGGICHQIIRTTETGRWVARVEPRATASFAPVVAREIDLQGSWVTIDELCATLQLSLAVAQYLVQDLHFRFRKETYDVGLHFRFFKRGLLRAGFVRRKGHCMQGALVYSPRAVEYIQAYRKHVPELFDGLDNVEAKRAQPTKTRIGLGTTGQPFSAAEIFSQDLAESVLERCNAFRSTFLANIWMEPLYHNCSAVVDSLIVKELEGYLDAEERPQIVEVEINDDQVLRPGAITDMQHDKLSGQVSSSPARATLGSRVCYILSSGVVQFGTTGTVVGIHPPKISDASSIGWTLDVVISITPKQKCAIGGSSLGGRCSALRGVSVPASHVINIGQDCAFPETSPIEVGSADKETLNAVKDQIEFYLSDKNLRKDPYFRPLVQLHPDGFVAISKFLSCNRMKQLTSDSLFVAEACRCSEHLIVSTDGTAIRRAVPWTVPPQHAKQQHRRKTKPTARETGSETTPDASLVSEHTACVVEPQSQRGAKRTGQAQQHAGQGGAKSAMRPRCARSRNRAEVSSVAGCASTALVPVGIMVAATVQPQLRRHTIIALSIWPTCLLVGHVAAQWARPTRKGIMKRTPPATAAKEYSATRLSTAATATASGIAVVVCRCAETLQDWYENPSLEAAMQMMSLASIKLHEDRWATTTAETFLPMPPLVVNKPGAAVVAMSLMPFGYVCGNFWK